MQDSTFAEYLSNDMRIDNLGQLFVTVHISPPLPPVNGTYQAYLTQFPNGFRKWTNGKDLQICWPTLSQQLPNTRYSENPYVSAQYPPPQKQLPAVFESFHYSASVLVGNCIPGAASKIATVYDYCGLAGSFRVIARVGEVNVHWDIASEEGYGAKMTRPKEDVMIGGLGRWDGMERTGWESNRLEPMMEIAPMANIGMAESDENVESQTSDILKPVQMDFAPKEEYTEFTQFVDVDGLYAPSSQQTAPPRDHIIAPKPVRCTVSKLLSILEPEPFELPELVFDTPELENISPAFDASLDPHYSPSYTQCSDPFTTSDQMDMDLDLSPMQHFSYPVQGDWSIPALPMIEYGMDGQGSGKGTYTHCPIPGLGMDCWS